MTIVTIMAGGLGKRMNSTIPKVLHLVGNEPMLVRVIKTALQINPKKIFIIVGKYKLEIELCLKEYNVLNNIEFIIQETALGTGHAIQCCVPMLEKCEKDDNIIILSGDVPLITEKLLKDLNKNINYAKIVTTNYDNPQGYGRIICKNDKFLKIVEEKDCNDQEKQCKIINSGIYAFKNKYLLEYVMKLNTNNAQNEYYLTDIFEIILKSIEGSFIDLLNILREDQYQLEGINNISQLNEMNKLYEKMNNKELIFCCPHCNQQIIINIKDLNCKIFRHGILKSTYKQIDPHMKKIECDKLSNDGLIYGCGRPFRIFLDNTGDYNIIECEYI